MAARGLYASISLRSFLRRSLTRNLPVTFQTPNLRNKGFCSSSSSNPYKSTEDIDIESLFISQPVQRLLRKLTGLDFKKIFAPKKAELTSPKYKFLTDEQLKKALDEAKAKARRKIQMPPVLRERKDETEILAKDPEIQGYDEDNSRYVFTDISYGYKDRERIVVVREPDGLLRTATWEEKNRMNQIYFTIPNKDLVMPKMFQGEYLQAVLDKQWYMYVLDRACVQFEPDDPEYIRVTQTTYDHIDTTRKFDVLTSTRHYGPMVFYFVAMKKIDNLLTELIQKERIQDGGDLIRLYHIVHLESKSAKQTEADISDLELIKNFIKNDSKKRSHLELALQTYEEIAHHKQEVEEGLEKAQGQA